VAKLEAEEARAFPVHCGPDTASLSVVGLSFDFLALNVTGYLCYSVYNTTLMTNPAVRVMYCSDYDLPQGC